MKIILWILEQIIIPFFAVIAGAGLAFWNDRRLRKDDERDRRVMASFQMLHVLLQQGEELNHLSRCYSNGKPGQVMCVARNLSLIDKNEFAFLAKDYPNELNEALMSERQYMNAWDALQTYNEVSRDWNEICRTKCTGIREGGMFDYVPDNQTEVLELTVKGAWDQFGKAVENGTSKNKDVAKKMKQVFEKIFPGVEFWESSELKPE